MNTTPASIQKKYSFTNVNSTKEELNLKELNDEELISIVSMPMYYS